MYMYMCVYIYDYIRFGFLFTSCALCELSVRGGSLSRAMTHMAVKELAMVDEMQKAKPSAGEIIDRLQQMHRKDGETGPSQSADYQAMGVEFIG